MKTKGSSYLDLACMCPYVIRKRCQMPSTSVKFGPRPYWPPVDALVELLQNWAIPKISTFEAFLSMRSLNTYTLPKADRRDSCNIYFAAKLLSYVHRSLKMRCQLAARPLFKPRRKLFAACA